VTQWHPYASRLAPPARAIASYGATIVGQLGPGSITSVGNSFWNQCLPDAPVLQADVVWPGMNAQVRGNCQWCVLP